MVSRWSNFPIFTARNGQIKVLPIYMDPPISVGFPDIIMGGCAPVIFVDAGAGTTCFTYYPSSIGTVNVLGDAVATFTPAPAKERGGKGTPHWKRQKQATHFYFNAEAFFENTLQLGGAADASFRPAPYQFIKSLPKVPYTPPRRDSEFVDLFKKLEAQPQTTTFSYEASGGVVTAGDAKDEYFDFRNFIIMHDEDILIADILSSDGSPYITTTFDNNLAKLRRDDDEVIEIFELL